MPKWFSVVCAFITLVVFSPVRAQSPASKPVVISPRASEAVQGRVEINGISGLDGFQRVEVEYRYTNDPKKTWFLIGESDQPVNPGKIMEWDTSTITDGNYDLRLTVYLKDGTDQSTLVSGIRVRNYSPIETPTPAEPGTTEGQPTKDTPLITTASPRPTRPVFPTNPAVLTLGDINSGLIRGAVSAIGFFLAFGVYWIIKKSLS